MSRICIIYYIVVTKEKTERKMMIMWGKHYNDPQDIDTEVIVVD